MCALDGLPTTPVERPEPAQVFWPFAFLIEAADRPRAGKDRVALAMRSPLADKLRPEAGEDGRQIFASILASAPLGPFP
jgi:hypothetical protein